MSTTPVVLTADATSLETAQANVLAASTQQAANLNQSLTSIYLGAFDNWKTSVDAGRINNSNPPQPPVGYVVITGADGFAQIVLGKDPVCAMPPIPEDQLTPKPPSPPNTIDIGANIFGKWYSVGSRDTFAVGMTTPPMPDGHTYEKYGAPVGPGWYLQVS